MSGIVPLPPFGGQVYDRYHAATSVLRSWVNHWLAIPVSYYFYMPQPGYGHLLYAVTMLARQARISLLANAQPNVASYLPSNTSAENLQDTSSKSDAEATETLVLNALETFATRFEAARLEIGAAHGQEWENDLLDQIANTLRVKKTRIVKWSQVLRTAIDDGRSGGEMPPVYPSQAYGSVEGQESNIQVSKDAAQWSFERFCGSLLDDNYQESWLWGSEPLSMPPLDQSNVLEETFGSGMTSLPNTGIRFQ